jgi:hypothetical protein
MKNKEMNRMPKLKELMTQDELSEYEVFEIEEHRKEKEASKKTLHKRTLERKRLCAIEEKMPACKLEQLLNDFKRALIHRIDTSIFKISHQRTTGLKEIEKDALKKIVMNISSKDLNNYYKRRTFARRIIRTMCLAIMIREQWEFGDINGPRELNILDAKFPSLIGISWNQYIEWVNQGRHKEGKLPIPIKEKVRKT